MGHVYTLSPSPAIVFGALPIARRVYQQDKLPEAAIQVAKRGENARYCPISSRHETSRWMRATMEGTQEGNPVYNAACFGVETVRLFPAQKS